MLEETDNEEIVLGKKLQVNFTGKTIVVVESSWGPIEFSINDLDITTAVVSLMLKESHGELGVTAFSDDDGEIMKNMLKRLN